jgi:hypothetical protein
LPAYRQKGRVPPGQTATVTVAGTSMKIRGAQTLNGGGAYFGVGDDRNMSIGVSTSQKDGATRATLAVIAKIARELPLANELIIRTSSTSLTKALTGNLEKLEDDGLADMENGDIFAAAVAALRRRGARTWIQDIAGQGGDIPHREAQRLASAGVGKPVDEKEDAIPPRFRTEGMRLIPASQKRLTKMITEGRKHTPKKGKERQIELMQRGAERLTGKKPTPAQVWKATRSKILLRPERSFLYWTINDAYKIGEYWERIPSYRQRGECRVCGSLETMNHILTECRAEARTLVWELARGLFEKKTETVWPGTAYETIMGSCMADFREETEEKRQGLNRFYTILMMTSAYLIWVIRCESSIPRSQSEGPKTHTNEEIHNRWIAKINHRIALDQILASRNRFGEMAIPIPVVLETWRNTLEDENRLPANWTGTNGVLVSIRPKRPAGRNR